MKMFWKHLMVLYLVMASGFVRSQSNNKSSDKICDEFQNHVGDKLNIEMVGLATSRMILITKSYFVYDVARGNMDSSIDNLYLDSAPVEMKDKYPVFWKDEKFVKIKDEIFNGFMMNFNGGDNICLTTDSTKTKDTGVNYNIDKNKVGAGWSFHPGGSVSIPEALISTDTAGMFYAIRSGSNNMAVAEYEYKSSTDTIDLKNDYRPICFGDTEKEIYVGAKGETCKKPISYPTMTGFVIDGSFILFSSTFVLSFDESIVQGSNKEKTTLKQTSYKDFFTCPGQIPPTTGKTSMTAMMISIAVLLLILGCCLLLYCYTYIRKKRGERRKKPQYGKKSSSVTAADTLATVRSLGHSTGTFFGLLGSKNHSKSKSKKSKKKSKSKKKKSKSKKNKHKKSKSNKKKKSSKKGKKSKPKKK